VYAGDLANVTALNSNFSHNRGRSGGALCVANNGTVTLVNTLFDTNDVLGSPTGLVRALARGIRSSSYA
jgi:hypothetical protein